MTRTVARALHPSAFQAYRADLASGATGSHAIHAVAIEVLSLLDYAEAASGFPPKAVELQKVANSKTRKFLEISSAPRSCANDDFPATSDVDVLRLLAEQLEDEGLFHLSLGLLYKAIGVTDNEIAVGRIKADKARNARRRGQLDLAAAQFEGVRRHGARIKSAEIRALGYLGLAGCAQARGNFEEVRKLLPLAIRASAKAQCRRLLAQSHIGVGIAAATGAEYGRAVEHLWQAYQLAEADEMLAHQAGCNLTQVLVLSGRSHEARGLANSLFQSTLPVRTALPLLGAFAIAAARLGIRREVEWACGQLERLEAAARYPREFAGALVECAVAIEAVGEPTRGRALHDRAEALAYRHGFHDLTFVEAIAVARAPAPAAASDRGAARAARPILQLELEEHPHEIAVKV